MMSNGFDLSRGMGKLGEAMAAVISAKVTADAQAARLESREPIKNTPKP